MSPLLEDSGIGIGTESDSESLCRHWVDPDSCECVCTCGHLCKFHPGGLDGACDLCDCEDWNAAY